MMEILCIAGVLIFTVFILPFCIVMANTILEIAEDKISEWRNK